MDGQQKKQKQKKKKKEKEKLHTKRRRKKIVIFRPSTAKADPSILFSLG